MDDTTPTNNPQPDENTTAAAPSDTSTPDNQGDLYVPEGMMPQIKGEEVLKVLQDDPNANPELKKSFEAAMREDQDKPKE